MTLTRKEMENFCADALGHDDMSDYSTEELRRLLKTTKGEYAPTLWDEALDYNNKSVGYTCEDCGKLATQDNPCACEADDLSDEHLQVREMMTN